MVKAAHERFDSSPLTRLRKIRKWWQVVLKTMGCKSLEGSIPLSSANKGFISSRLSVKQLA